MKTYAPFPRKSGLFVRERGKSGQSTGEFFDFESDTTAVSVRTVFAKQGFGENSFNSSACVGTDLYVFDSERGGQALGRCGGPWCPLGKER